MTKAGLKKDMWVELDELACNRLASKMGLPALQGLPPDGPRRRSSAARPHLQATTTIPASSFVPKAATPEASKLPNPSASIWATLRWQLLTLPLPRTAPPHRTRPLPRSTLGWAETATATINCAPLWRRRTCSRDKEKRI